MTRSMTMISALAGAFALAGLSVPAYAQMGGAGLNPGSPIGGVPHLHRPNDGDQPPPPGLPGASELNSTSSSQVQIENEDPTKVLFSAINHDDYTEARAAISRGADLGAHNALGETPLEMSIALNHNNITFMLLSMRGADSGNMPQPVPAPAPAMIAANNVRAHQVRPYRVRQAPARPVQTPVSQASVSQDPGVPNPSAGFLGFGGSS